MGTINASTGSTGNTDGGWGTGTERQVKVLITEVPASLLERIEPAGCAAARAVGILVTVWAGV